jgi:opacity protein-like surface antigen
MRFGPLVLTLLLVLTSNSPALAQKQNFELGGGGGFTWPSDPEVSLGRGWDLGGFFGIRFNDNFSLETDFSFSRTNNQFFDESIPIVPTQEGEGWTFQPFSPIEPFTDFGLQNTQYHLDAVLVIHIGRRQPFHPFVFGGAGVLREDKKTTDLTPLRGTATEEVETSALETKRETNYYPVLAVGAGFDFYILYNVAARFEYRLWTTKDWERRTQRLFFTAIYFF